MITYYVLFSFRIIMLTPPAPRNTVFVPLMKCIGLYETNLVFITDKNTGKVNILRSKFCNWVRGDIFKK